MISSALRALAEDVEASDTVTLWDAHRQPTEEQQAAKSDKVRAAARDLHVLANDAEIRSVHYAEFDTIKDRLYVVGLALTPKLVENVATAFRDAKGPVKVLDRGWLKKS